MTNFYKVVVREVGKNVFFEKTVFRSSNLNDCEQLVYNHRNSAVRAIRTLAENYIILDAQERVVELAA
jgi:hypothetical protein